MLVFLGFTFLYRLFEAAAFAIHLKDVTMMSQPIQQGSSHPLSLKDLLPFAERKVAVNQQVAPLIAIGKDLEQKLSSCSADPKCIRPADRRLVVSYARDLAKCVHICEAVDFVSPRQVNKQLWVVLHELTHAYHDQVLGFDDASILETYERFKQSGRSDSALLITGKRGRHYALTDQKEFFAEMTEAYFCMNNFFPFNRAELMTTEPEIFGLLQTVWGQSQPSQK